jgi:hypothetical protein
VAALTIGAFTQQDVIATLSDERAALDRFLAAD